MNHLQGEGRIKLQQKDQLYYLCFRMSLTPPLPEPSRSAGLSRHSFLTNAVAVLPIRLLGISNASMPWEGIDKKELSY
jgi:hypothetical protein